MTAGRSGPDHLRIGDAEREAAASALGEHYAAGRITREELEDRTTAVYAARTDAELRPLFADLPATGGPARQHAARTGPSRGWWPGVALGPLLVVAVALAALTHLPWLLLLVAGWFWLGRTSRHCFSGASRRPATRAP